jgi:hypothetical protein
MIVVTAALAVGALDAAQFATRTQKRAAQSVAAATIWAGGFVFSLFSARGDEVATVLMTAVIALGSLGLLLIHVRHGIATPRVWLAPALGLVAFFFATVSL